MFSHEWSKFESLLEMSTANFWVSFHVRPRIKCSIFYLCGFSQNPKEQSSPKFKIEKYKPSLWLSCFDKLGWPGKERAKRKTFWSQVVQNPRHHTWDIIPGWQFHPLSRDENDTMPISPSPDCPQHFRSLSGILTQGPFQCSPLLHRLFIPHWIYLSLERLKKVYKLLDERNLAVPFFCSSRTVSSRRAWI